MAGRIGGALATGAFGAIGAALGVWATGGLGRWWIWLTGG